MARKIALATLLLTVIALVWNGVLHLVLLRGIEEPARRLFRRELPFALSIALTVAIVLLFLLGYTRFRRKGGLSEGAQYGFFFGILAGVLVDANQYVLYPIPATIALVWFIGGLIEFTVYGIIASAILAPKVVSSEQLEAPERKA